MAKNDNLVGQGFHTNPERRCNGRQKGVKNRSTILKELLALQKDEAFPNQEYQVNQALIDKALSGDVPAIKEIQDTMYGKMVEKLETIQEITTKQSPEELKAEAEKRGLPTKIFNE
jgi:hypothetical protein